MNQAAIDRIQNEISDRMLTMCLDMTAAIVLRVQQTGTDSKGVPFSPYSTTPLDPSSFMSAGNRKGAASKLEQLKGTGQKLSYADFRQLVGNQVAYKDFTLTGRTLSQFDVVETGFDGAIAFCWLGLMDADSAEIHRRLVQQEQREILEPSEAEMEQAADDLTEWLMNIIETT